MLIKKDKMELNRNLTDYNMFLGSQKLNTCTVLPSPISSARIPFKWLLYRETSHLRPFIWYLRTKHAIRKNISPYIQNNREWKSKVLLWQTRFRKIDKKACKVRRIKSQLRQRKCIIKKKNPTAQLNAIQKLGFIARHKHMSQLNNMHYKKGKCLTYSLNFPPCKLDGCSAMLSFILQEGKS